MVDIRNAFLWKPFRRRRKKGDGEKKMVAASVLSNDILQKAKKSNEKLIPFTVGMGDI